MPCLRKQSRPPAPQTVESLSTNNLPRHTPCTPSNLANYLHNSPVAGLHVVCIDPIHVDANGKEKPHAQTDVDRQHRIEQSNSLRLTFYKGSHSSKIRRRVTMSGDKGVESISWNEMKMQLSLELGLIPPGRKQQPWAIFTPLGERIVGTDEMVADDNLMTKLASSEMLVITNGGVWIWPGVREGFERTIELPPTKYDKNSREVTIETLSLQPLVLSVEGFLTDEECKYIPEVAGPSMEYSEVSLKDADKGKAASEWRTSQSTFLPANDDSILKAIDERTAKLVRVPRTHQEYAQVLRYGPTEKYDAHHDYFDPAAYQSDEGTLALIEVSNPPRSFDAIFITLMLLLIANYFLCGKSFDASLSKW